MTDDDNKKDVFRKLDRFLDRLDRVRALYWLAALLFWIGTLLTIPYFFAQTGTKPSWIPAIMIFSSLGIYILSRNFTK